MKVRRNNCLNFYITQVAILIISTAYDFSLAFSTCEVEVKMKWLICNKNFTLSILLELIGYQGTVTWISLSILYWANIGQFSTVVKKAKITFA